MKIAPRIAWAVVVSCLAANPVSASEEQPGEAPADPTAAPTVELQQEKDSQSGEGDGLAIHGLGYLSFMTPLEGSASLNLLLLQGEVKYNLDHFGVFATPRFRVTSVSNDDSEAYLFFQQAYGVWRHPLGDVKVGKIYQRFGRLWDYGFYGPLLANDDVKLQPDLGVALEGAPQVAPQLDLEYAAQYFAVDGRAFSLRNSHLFARQNVRRRNITVLRAAPKYHFDSNSAVAVGFSGSRFEATYDGHPVLRGAVDADLTYGPLTAFVEIGRQNAPDLASASGAVSSHSYAWAGASYDTPWVKLRYHVNAIIYDKDHHRELLHQPGLEASITENWGMMAEVAWWGTNDAKRAPYRERSMYLIATGRF